MAIESPCRKICIINEATRLCEGCGRTLAEIASWGSLSPGERQRIMAELPGRRTTPDRI